jgi:hypothetical protein
MQKEVLDIIDVYRKNLFLQESIRGLMKKSGSKSYGRIFNAVQSLINEGILISHKQGKSTVCSINMGNFKTLHYLSFLDFIESDSKLTNETKLFLNQIDYLLPNKYYSLLVSYLKNKEPEMVFILDDEVDASRVLNSLNNYFRLNSPGVNCYVYRSNEFVSMLLAREDNFVKKIFLNHFVPYGSLEYHRLIKEAIKNGFRI